MEGIVILVAGIFLDFGASLIIIIPIRRFSLTTKFISELQSTIVFFGLIDRHHNDVDKEVHGDAIFEINRSHKENEKYAERAKHYEKHLLPYGLVFLGIGFVFTVMGSMLISLKPDL